MAFGVPDEVVAQAQAGMVAHVTSQQNIVALLEQIAQAQGPGLQTIAITDQELGGGYETDFPVEGAKRWLVPRLAVGGDFTIPSTLVSVLTANNRRLGGTIVNEGKADVKLILATPQRAAAGEVGLGPIYLRAGGGSWDFRLGSMLWCGSICARALPTESGEVEIEETTLAVVEV